MDILKSAIYIRVSTDEQAKKGYSLSTQEERLRTLAHSSDWSVYKVYCDDGYSAKNRNRPALKRLFQDAKLNKFDVILVYKIDRLSRSLKDLIEIIGELNNYKIGFKSATEMIDTTTPEGRLIFHQFGSFAQYERELIAQRTKLGMMRRLKQGLWNTIPPFGYKLIEGKLEINEKEAEVLKSIFNLYLNKNMGVKSISHELNDRNIKPRSGVKWRGNRIYKILVNPVYTGVVRWGGEEAEGIHKALISREDFELVQERLKNKKPDTRRFRSPNYLTGLVKCGLCDSSMVVVYPGRKEQFKYYVCNSRNTTGECRQDYIRVDILEKSIINEIKKFSRKKKIINELISDYLAHSRGKVQELSRSLEDIKDKMKSVKLEKERIADTIIYKNPDTNMIKILNEKSDRVVGQEEGLQKQIWKIEDKIQSLQSKNYGVKGISDYLKNFTNVFDQMDFGERKLVIESIIEEIKIERDKKVSFTFIPPYNNSGVSTHRCVPKELNTQTDFKVKFKYDLISYYLGQVCKTFIYTRFSSKKYTCYHYKDYQKDKAIVGTNSICACCDPSSIFCHSPA